MDKLLLFVYLLEESGTPRGTGLDALGEEAKAASEESSFSCQVDLSKAESAARTDEDLSQCQS